MGYLIPVLVTLVFCIFILVILAIFFSRVLPEIRSNPLFRKILIVWTSLITGLLIFLIILAFRFDGDWRSSSSITVSDYSSELIY